MGKRTGNRYYMGPHSDHFDGERFFNPGIAPLDNSVGQLLRWKLTAKRGLWQRNLAGPSDQPPPRSDAIRVAMIGHSSVLLQVAGLNLLVDPVFSDRASPFSWLGPRRYNPPGIAFDALPPINTVLITHNHYDHMDLPTLRRLHEAHRPVFVMPLGNDTILRGAIPDARIQLGDWGDRASLADNIGATFWPAYHWSARGVFDRLMALWCGYLLHTPHGLIYLAGDTGYGQGEIFRAIPRDHGAVTLAILPIGAYEPRWFMQTQHANPADAVQIFHDCGAAQALGVHWNTFRLTDEAQTQPAIDLQAALARDGIAPARFIALKSGQVWSGQVWPGQVWDRISD